MNALLIMLGLATLLLALGTWLALPRGRAGGRAFGVVLVAVSLGLFAAQTPALGSLAADVVFYLLAAVTVGSAVATITFRNPVYSAIWFAMSLLGTAGLFLYDGAQFLGVATIVVYAGAILVTFLFVLMLAQPQGQAPYDRVTWAAPLSAASGALLVGLLTLVLVGVFQNPTTDDRPTAPHDRAALEKEVLANQHMAHLGGQLFSHHLLAVEFAGTLLLVALVGCIGIVAHLHKRERGGPMHE